MLDASKCFHDIHAQDTGTNIGSVTGDAIVDMTKRAEELKSLKWVMPPSAGLQHVLGVTTEWTPGIRKNIGFLSSRRLRHRSQMGKDGQ